MKNIFKKAVSLMLAVSTVAVMANFSVAQASLGSETDAMSISGVHTGGTALTKLDEATLTYKGAKKTFTDNTYLCVPYSEIKMNNEDNIVDNGPLADYDKVEFYVGLASDSSATDGVKINIFKYVDGGKDANGTVVKKEWEADTVYLNPGDEAKKITLSLNGYDSVQMNISAEKAAESDRQKIKLVYADFKGYKSDLEYDVYTVENNGNKFDYKIQGQFGGITQSVRNSQSIQIHSGAKYYIEPKYNALDGSKYSEMEFYLGTAAYTPVEGIDQYAQIAIMETTDDKYNVNSGLYIIKEIKLGEEPQLVSLPIRNTTKAMKWIVKHGYKDASGNFVQFQEGNEYNIESGSAHLGVFDFKLFKNKNSFVSNFATAWNNLGSQTMTNPGNVNYWWNNADWNFTVGDKGGDKWYSDGKHWSQDITVKRNEAGSAGSMAVTFVTEGYVDRFTGLFGVAAGQSVAARPEDYIVVKGYNWKNAQAKDVNDNFAGTNGSKGTVLYSAYGMPDGFVDPFDLDVSDYDYIRIFTNFNGTRRASIMDYVFHQYNAKDVTASFDKETNVITSTSKQARTAGTMAAVAYADNKPVAVVMNNDAKMGLEVASVTGKAANNVNVIAKNTLDCTTLRGQAEYIDYYYVDGTALETLDVNDLSALTQESFVKRYFVAADITEAENLGKLNVTVGTSFNVLDLPQTVSVKKGGKTYTGIGVTWTAGSYNPQAEGTYTIEGTLSETDLNANNLTNTNGIKATIEVKVAKVEIARESGNVGTVDFGGGGFVIGVVFHPLNNNIAYARTDVGGAYRYEADTQSWTCITDTLPHPNMQGIDAIAVDPQNENVVYICAGTYWYNAGHGIFKSEDKGNTWKDISFTADSRVFSGNSMGRNYGESFVVDPKNSNVLYCGTRTQGLWVSTDGGENWTQTTVPYYTNSNADFGTNCNGVRTIAIDTTGESSVVYAGTFGNANFTGGVYTSTDNGATWTAVNGGPTKPARMKTVGSDLYVVAEDNTASFWKYSNGTWSNITPSGYGSAGSFDTYQNASGETVIYLGEIAKSAKIYKKVGNGDWSVAFVGQYTSGNSNAKITCDVTRSANWFTDGHSQLLGQYSYCGDIKIREVGGKHEMWVTDGGVGIWRNEDVEASKTFYSNVKGIEVTSSTNVEVLNNTTSGYTLITSNHDYGIIATKDETNSASTTPIRTINTNDWFGQVGDIDSCDTDSNYIAFTTSLDGDETVAVSTDGGNSFSNDGYYTTSSAAGVVAVSAVKNDSDVPNMVTIAKADEDGDGGVLYSADFGESWQESTGIEASVLTNTSYDVIDSDKVNANVFYVYDVANAQVYVTKDGGENFTAGAVNAIISSPDLESQKNFIPTIKAVPGKEGHVWVSNSKGIFLSTNYGDIFKKVASNVSINGVRSFTFGKGKTEGTYAAYVLGNVEGTYGLFRSDDEGATWVMQNDTTQGSLAIHQYGIKGDMNNYGRVYIATGGRGIMTVDTGDVIEKEPFVLKDNGTSYTAELIYDGNVQVIAASYNSDKTLKSIKMSEVTTIDGSGTVTVAKPDTDANSTVKVFVWDSANSMTPIFEAK